MKVGDLVEILPDDFGSDEFDNKIGQIKFKKYDLWVVETPSGRSCHSTEEFLGLLSALEVLALEAE